MNRLVYDRDERKIMESHLFCLVAFKIYIFDLFMLVSPYYLLLSVSITHFSEVFWTTYTYFNIASIFYILIRMLFLEERDNFY